MKELPTAEEFLNERATPPYAFLCENIIEFAIIHVEAFKQELLNNISCTEENLELYNFILNYPTPNIK
jgi:hypothetical protein